ncbi:acetyltransferase [Sinorhizobium meliloti]
MTAADRYSFRKATVNDLPLLAAWRSNPHVRAWWGSDGSHDAADLADPRVARWIVSTAERPFAFMQDYTVHGWENHHFAELPEGSRGIDQS